MDDGRGDRQNQRFRSDRLWALFTTLLVCFATGCVVSADSDCRSDDECAADQRCLGGGGLLVRDGVCVDQSPAGAVDAGPDAEFGDADVAPGDADVASGDADTDLDVDVGEPDVEDVCPDGESECEQGCVDTETSADFCGDCETSCGNDEFCYQGVCTAECDDSSDEQQLCDDICINPMTSVEHCGSCDNDCEAAVDNAQPVCDGGECSFVCDDGFEQCEPGECTDLDSDFDHCGSCDSGCSGAESCEEGQCVAPPCDPGGEPFGGGEGSTDEPYAICTSDQLFAIDDHLDDHFQLYDDLDLGGEQVTPMGYPDSAEADLEGAFTGSLDGGGFEISNFSISSSGVEEAAGLFAALDGAVIRDLHVANAEIIGAEFGGLLVAFNAGEIINSSSHGAVSEILHGGGLVGINDESAIITGSSSSADVMGSEAAGGLVGWSLPESRIEGSHATGDVEGEVNVGGLVGRIGSVGGSDWSEVEPPLEDSYAAGDVDGEFAVGGLVGMTEGSIYQSYAEGAVTGQEAVGGLVGYTRVTDFGTFSTISDSYAAGDVSGDSMVGGLVGNHHGHIEDSSASGDVEADSDVGGLVGRSDSVIGQDNGRIDTSYATGIVVGYELRVGGLIGELRGQVAESFATGSVVADDAHVVGGLVGRVHQRGDVRDCYAIGDVEADHSIGGLVGGVSQGGNHIGRIDTSYSTGAVTGDSAIGGLVGTNEGEVDNSYWNEDSSGVPDSSGGEPRNDSEFMEPGSFGGFDFFEIWEMSSERPVLQWE